ncbi:MAG: helix-turn-helix domain-containing protein [Cytophagaceae bacterium]|nr:helix-turn-helix domain-containing protein [Gemmatimonadaceae bacterium]
MSLLRRGRASVEELARTVGLTDNAVRSHLTTLERDGLIRQEGVRRTPGAGKPATLYEIHPDADALFSRAFQPVLEALLDELRDSNTTQDGDDLMHRVGHRLARVMGRAPVGDLGSRVAAGAAVLDSLGGVTEVEKTEGAFLIRGCGACPLSPATARHPELCGAIEALLSDYVGAPVRERCQRGERPRCTFEVSTAA